MSSSLLWGEIQSQPRILSNLLREGREAAGAIVKAWQRRKPAFAFVAARGSSDNAGRYAQYLLGSRHRLPIGLATPSLHTLYGASPDYGAGVVLGISQSGESPDIVRVVEDAAGQGALTVAITNRLDSPLARAAGYCLPLGVGEERSIAATKTYTAQLGALALLSVKLAGEEPVALERLPVWMAATLQAAEEVELGGLSAVERCPVLARGFNFATAHEVALKLKELALVAAEPFSAADYRHGPIALAQEGQWAVLVGSRGPPLEDIRRLAGELQDRGLRLLVVGNDPALSERAERSYAFPASVPEWLSPLVAILPGQVLAFRLAQARGLDPDRPPLDRKVTKTL